MRGSRNNRLISLLASGLVVYLLTLWNGHRHIQDHYQSVSSDFDKVASNSWEQTPVSPSSSFRTNTEENDNASADEPSKIDFSPLTEQKASRQHPLYSLSQQKRLTKQRTLRFRTHPNDGRPPFDSLFDPTGNMTSLVQSALDFAIVGFGKAGTTTLMTWLDSHPEVQLYPAEVYDLMKREPQAFLRKLYSLPEGQYKRGYKSPVELSLTHVMQDYYAQYWPQTKLLVGIRHPVSWFESLYNFRLQNMPPRFNISDFPHPNRCIGKCVRNSRNVCTYKAEFAMFLRNLGKALQDDRHHYERDASADGVPRNQTNQRLADPNLPLPWNDDEAWNRGPSTEFERRMYRAARVGMPHLPRVLPNPVFLFEINQLRDDVNDESAPEAQDRSRRFRQDLQNFLGLEQPLPAIPHEKPGRVWAEHVQAEKDAHKISICDDEYIPLRTDLMRIARTTSVWIRKYFLPHTLHHPQHQVTVSSPAHFEELMLRWMKDPCGENATRSAGRYVLDAAD